MRTIRPCNKRPWSCWGPTCQRPSAPSWWPEDPEDPLHRGDRVRQPHGRADGGCHGRRGHGWLQHLLRNPLLRQACALIVPRVKPREEQLLRAQRASALGLVDMLLPDQSADPTVMSEALKRLPERVPPSKSDWYLATGKALDHISQTVGHWLDGRGRHLSVVGAD